MQPDTPQLSAHLPPESAHSRVLAACARPSCSRKLPPQGTLCSLTCLRGLATTSSLCPHCMVRSDLHNDNFAYLACCCGLPINCLSAGSVWPPSSLVYHPSIEVHAPQPTKHPSSKHASQILCARWHSLIPIHQPSMHRFLQ